MKLILPAIALVLCLGTNAQSGDNHWSASTDKNVALNGKRQIVPNKYLVYNLNLANLKAQLAAAPNEKTTIINNSNCIITLPAPNGEMQLFKVVEAPIMEPALAAAYPDIKTYSIKGITDVYANGKIDVNEFGFHGMIRTINGDFFIDPYCLQNTADYITYYTADFVKPEQDRLPEVGLQNSDEQPKKKENVTSLQSTALMPPAACVGANLRTYRLAVACTGEYAVAATGSATPTKAQALAKIVTSVNRVTGVYETEAAVRLVLVATETIVIFTSGASDPFNNTNAGVLIGQSQSVITASIGTANFDIGHTFSTGGGGLATLGCVCNSGSKAQGITGSPSPVGDPYDIDYVAHEMGHQFAGNHTFNSSGTGSGSCNGNRNASTSVEPGGGVTIMGYAGICGSQDIASNSIAYFHATSYDEIVNFTQLGSGNGCAVTSATGNQPPVVTVSGNFFVPANTAFTLTGSATDPNSDPLTYSWEERDAGSAAGNWNSGSKPFFRSYNPNVSSTRMFPPQSQMLNNQYQSLPGEYMPTTAQTLNFRLTARDNKMGGGGVCYAQSTISVSATSGSFAITYPNSTGIVWGMAQLQNVTWNVNGTDVAPVNSPLVNILISYNSGITFTTLLANTPNDGIEVITVPTLTAGVTTCRIKVESANSIFFDVNNPDFEIAASVTGLQDASAGNALGVLVLPNPFTNDFQLKVGALSSSSKTEVIITDVLGKVIKQMTYDKVSILDELIDLSEFKAAVYFVTVANNNTKTTTRVIKQ
ncbi:MAG: T9SS type A sorting domain-containing protein [Bacteroidia bacterium]|jgi:Metallo-peptidase family M12/Secretion system C-terminal sorting domain|nr:T9SS type A sorting domain-containing protein [Bacteroidia bacterium]